MILNLFFYFVAVKTIYNKYTGTFMGGAVVSWLVHSTLERVVWVRALAGGHCVVFLGKTFYSRSASLHPDV